MGTESHNYSRNTGWQIPTVEEAADRFKVGPVNPIDQFVLLYRPSDFMREKLLDLLNFASNVATAEVAAEAAQWREDFLHVIAKFLQLQGACLELLGVSEREEAEAMLASLERVECHDRNYAAFARAVLETWEG